MRVRVMNGLSQDKYSVTADIVLPSALPTQKPLIIIV